MGPELLAAHHDDDIGQDITAPQAIKVEEDVTGMASELDTAVGRRGHFVSTWAAEGKNLVSSLGPDSCLPGM